MLKRLTTKNRLKILGLNSGTSADGLDLALIECNRLDKDVRVKFVDGEMYPYPTTLRRELGKVLDGDGLSIEQLARFNITYGKYLGRMANDYISRKKRKVDLIGSHGQTVKHYPTKEKCLGEKASATIQIGDGTAVSTATGVPVVSDFRAADIALGGEGAPLTPFVNHVMFGDRKISRIIINIGGIANFSYHPAGGELAEIAGGDCGPGNRLSDIASEILFKRKFDRDGNIAQKGCIVEKVVKRIIGTGRRSTVSLGREQFDELLIARLVYLTRRERASYEDLMASIVDASARMIFRSIKKYLKDTRLGGVYLTGGGRRNIFLVERLQKYIHPACLWPIERLNYDGDLLEATSFAILAGCYVYGIPSTLPQISGACRGGVAGKLSLPRDSI